MSRVSTEDLKLWWSHFMVRSFLSVDILWLVIGLNIWRSHGHMVTTLPLLRKYPLFASPWPSPGCILGVIYNKINYNFMPLDRLSRSANKGPWNGQFLRAGCARSPAEGRVDTGHDMVIDGPCSISELPLETPCTRTHIFITSLDRTAGCKHKVDIYWSTGI